MTFKCHCHLQEHKLHYNKVIWGVERICTVITRVFSNLNQFYVSKSGSGWKRGLKALFYVRFATWSEPSTKDAWLGSIWSCELSIPLTSDDFSEIWLIFHTFWYSKMPQMGYWVMSVLISILPSLWDTGFNGKSTGSWRDCHFLSKSHVSPRVPAPSL